MSRPSSAAVKKSKHFLFFTTICGILAALILLTGSITFFAANRLMRHQVKPLETSVNNLMPPFEPASFLSIDDDINLSGWFFRATEKPKHITVILVHDFNSNRAPFGSKTANLIHSILADGYNVLTFDQRHAGNSDGQLTNFGHSEWLDVLGAIRYLEKAAGSADCILYSIGSGITASLNAWQSLHAPAQTADSGRLSDVNKEPPLSQAKNFQTELIKHNIAQAALNQKHIKGMILDTALPTSDDYIRQAVRTYGGILAKLTARTVPSAVRLTGETGKSTDIKKITAELPCPILFIIPESRQGVSEDKLLEVPRARAVAKPELTYAVDASNKVRNEPGSVEPETGSVATVTDTAHREEKIMNDSFSGDSYLYCQNISLFLESLGDQVSSF